MSRVGSYPTFSTLPGPAERGPRPEGLRRCVFCCTLPGLGGIKASLVTFVPERYLDLLAPGRR